MVGNTYNRSAQQAEAGGLARLGQIPYLKKEEGEGGGGNVNCSQNYVHELKQYL